MTQTPSSLAPARSASGSHERAPRPRSPSPSSPPAKSPRPSVPASEYDSEFDFSDAEAQDRTAGVVHDAVQQAVMQYGYDDELFQAWRDGEIRRKDLPEEVVAMALDLCERWRAEQERCRRVHAAQRLSRDHSPSRSRSRGAAAPTLQLSRRAAALFFLVSGRSDQGEGTD